MNYNQFCILLFVSEPKTLCRFDTWIDFHCSCTCNNCFYFGKEKHFLKFDFRAGCGGEADIKVPVVFRLYDWFSTEIVNDYNQNCDNADATQYCGIQKSGRCYNVGVINMIIWLMLGVMRSKIGLVVEKLLKFSI